jgi:type IV secretory pathway VirB10-like protein
MFSKPLAFGLLALSCVTAAAGGAYLATRHNAAEAVAVHPAATAAAPASVPASPSQPVAETEAAVGSGASAATPAKPAEAEARPAAPAAAPAESAPSASAPRRTPSPKAARAKTASQGRRPEPTRSASATPQRTLPAVEKSWPSRDGAAPAQTSDAQSAASAPPANGTRATEPARQSDPQPETSRVPQFEDLVLPASSVIGLQIQTPLTTERAHVEDRVDARVTRDVYVDGRVAIPAGSRVMGSVTFVNRGGKIKDTARLGIRFHTLVLADGTEVRLNTEPIYRDGESPSGDSAKKIGGGAVVGAVLGGILGGGKGAVIGGMAGAGGGTAAAMAGDRNAATFPSGTVVTARLSSPATIQVERR